MTGCGTWQEVSLQAKGRWGAGVRQLAFMSGRHSTLFTHMIFWAFLPLFLSIIHGRFNRVIPLANFPWDRPLARPLTTLIRGLIGGLGPSGLAPERRRNGITAAGCPHTNLSGPLPALIYCPELLGRKLGVSYINYLSAQSVGNVCWAQLRSGRGQEHTMVSVRGLRRERPGPQRLPNEGRQQLE